MEDKVLSFCRAHALIAPGSVVVCAVSGGKDSVALLHVMLALQKKLSIRVEAAHLNHQLRGEESERDEAFVRSLCRARNVPLHTARADVAARAEQTGESIEEAARRARYAFFQTLPGVVATAHTMDDNLETVLLNLIRGTSLRGLCGIPPKRGAIIRPMLPVSQEEVLAYLAANGLSHVEDSTNASAFARRNRLRHTLVPLFKQENPAICESVFRMDESLRQEDAYLDNAASALLSQASLEGGWSCKTLRAAPEVICARAMRALLSAQQIAKPAQCHVAALMQLISCADGSQALSLPGGVTARRAYDRLFFSPGAPQSFAPRQLPVPGGVEISELSLVISCRVVKNYQKTTPSPCTFALRYDTIKAPAALTVRPRQPGDQISLPGGSRSLKKLFIDRKLPAHVRALVPVVCDGDTVLLAYPIAASCAHTAQPGEAALIVQFTKEKETIQKEDSR